MISARAEVESAKLMRQAADILSSAPAMQIRYLEAMQSMAKSANSKVIFMPGSSGAASAAMGSLGELAQNTGDDKGNGVGNGMQDVLNARVIENI